MVAKKRKKHKRKYLKKNFHWDLFEKIKFKFFFLKKERKINFPHIVSDTIILSNAWLLKALMGIV